MKIRKEAQSRKLISLKTREFERLSEMIYYLNYRSSLCVPSPWEIVKRKGTCYLQVTMNDEFTTIRSKVRAEIKIEGSRFIAQAQPIRQAADASDILSAARKEFFDATHHCYAYRLGMTGGQFRTNDDGEPIGTAGKPILAAIDKFNLTDLVVVVTRYFGGTKLGAGGLARAYRYAAEQALGSAERVTRYVVDVLEAAFPHSHVGDVMHVVSKLGATITDTTYDEEVHITLEVRKSKLAELKSSLVNRTSGNVRILMKGN